MSYWMTQSLLSSWSYYRAADDAYADFAYQSFLSTLRREQKIPTKAMQMGIQFESDINELVESGDFTPPPQDAEKWDKAVYRFARICSGGRPQVPVSGELSVCGINFVLYGVCDYVRAGMIYDIKKVSRYEYGKYLNSPQHPMYLHLLPEAKRFDYLIFDGSFCYRETYRKGDFRPIEELIAEFIRWLREMELDEDYKAHWAMNEEREEKRAWAIALEAEKTTVI